MNSTSRSESGTSQTQYEAFDSPPSPKILMEDYSRDWGRPRSPTRTPRRRGIVSNPAAMHLLVESAVGESSSFDVMSMDELDELKKEEAAIKRKVPSLKRELQLESKVRDAANSLNRLSVNRGRDIMNAKGRGLENMSSEDFAASARKCEIIAQELWKLERRQTELRDRRLKHTAGVLQMEYEQRTGQSNFNNMNGLQQTDDWNQGFNLLQSAPGGIGDSSDGITDISASVSHHTDAMLNDLWDLMGSPKPSHAEAHSRGLNGVNGAKQDEEFSHDAFFERVQDLHMRASNLEAQMMQEREARNQADSSRSELIDELQDAHDKHQAEIMDLRGQLDETRHEASYVRQQGEQDKAAAERNIQNQLEGKTAQMREAEESLNHARSKLSEQEATIVSLQSSESSSTAKVSDMEAEVARLQTEVTVARAELDAAYGSRAQRAAEVADNPEIKRKLEDLEKEREAAVKRSETLQKELKDLVTEHESLVRQGVDTEREREAYEGNLDSLREKVESLEVKLGEERLRSIGKRRSGNSNDESTPGGGVESTSMSVMRSEFKKMMRDSRAEHFRGLKVRFPGRRHSRS